LGRAYLNQGQREAAMVLFQSIATQSQFYGQLAVEELGQKISIPVITAVPDTELVKLSANAGFQRARQFYALNLRFEAAREWNWELRKMTDSQLLAAAEFARQNGFLDRMLATSDRTKVVSDYTQRYPMPYRSIMTQATQVLGLDVAWVYGLIRQESRFITVARSNVGASGLMQVMPATARFVANKMKLVNFVPSQVNDIETNITLGTGYLSMIASSFNGSQALATAGYNAGPSRSRSWRNSLQQPVEGAIFAETIPFSETRGYVKNVLSNATYYAALFENVPQSLKARLGTISKD
jgi:soluble lytic murein transglycosylase